MGLGPVRVWPRPVLASHTMADIDIDEQIRIRASDVHQDGSYNGLFELTSWCSLREWKVLLIFGTSVVDVYKFCGHGLPKFTPKKTIRLVVVQATPVGTLMSADKSDSLVS